MWSGPTLLTCGGPDRLRVPKKARKVACLTVEYFFYCRGRPGTEALVDELAEAHWSFMDGYAAAMIARGPTLTPDRTTWTGSMHLVDLPDAEAARVFAFQEPFYRAGVYGEVLVAPEFIWELGIGIYLIVKGYRTSSPALAGTQEAVVKPGLA